MARRSICRPGGLQSPEIRLDALHAETAGDVTTLEGFGRDNPLAGPGFFFAVQSLEIVLFLEDSSRLPRHLCRAVYADTPLRRHADTVVIFGCGSAALSLCVFA